MWDGPHWDPPKKDLPPGAPPPAKQYHISPDWPWFQCICHISAKLSCIGLYLGFPIRAIRIFNPSCNRLGGYR